MCHLLQQLQDGHNDVIHITESRSLGVGQGVGQQQEPVSLRDIGSSSHVQRSRRGRGL